MRWRVLLTGLLMAGSLGALAVAEGKVDAAELKRFQGSWVMVSAEMDGKKVADAHVKQSKITFVQDKVELITPHQSKDKILAVITQLDPSAKPARMLWVRSTGPHAGPTMTAIYEFESADQYKVCFDPASTTVPTKFATKAGSGHIWHTWKRVKK